jgi:hypothetical protein
MECRDAQFYLRLRRHAADELGSDVTGALERHLATCPACAADARAALSFDRAMASAMKAVPVPAGLREKLLTQASAKQGTVLRRKLYRAVAACAAVLVVCGIAFGVFSYTRPKPDTQALVELATEQVYSPEETVKRWLVVQKLPDRLPEDFDYNLLVGKGFEEVQGKMVPVVTFRSPHEIRHPERGFARVYIFRDDGRFDLKGIPDAQASYATAKVTQSLGATYVIVYSNGPRGLQQFLRDPNDRNPGA